MSRCWPWSRRSSTTAFGVNLDTGNFHAADPYADVGRSPPTRSSCRSRRRSSRPGRREEADLGKVLGILKDANYRGYVALEYEAAEDPKTAVPRYVAELRKLIGGQ